MMKRLADLALLIAVLAIAVVAVVPEREPADQAAGQGGTETTNDSNAGKPDRGGGDVAEPDPMTDDG